MQRLHPKAVWLFFFNSFFGFFAVILFLLPSIIATQMAISEKTIFVLWGLLILIFFLCPIFCYIWAKLSYRFWGYELTEDAVKIEKGVIWKKYISVPYERVQNVDIYRGIIARLLGLSELHIQTAGYSGYGRYGRGTEGKLPGLDPQTAEQLREELIKKVRGTKQGL